MNLANTIELYGYGTSEGVTKAWDTRGRGRNSRDQKMLDDWGFNKSEGLKLRHSNDFAQVLSRQPRFSGTLYRSGSLTPDELKALQQSTKVRGTTADHDSYAVVGNQVTFIAHTSVTPDHELAKTMTVARKYDEPGKIPIIVEVHNAHDLPDISKAAYDTENREVVALQGTKAHFVSLQPEKFEDEEGRTVSGYRMVIKHR